MVGYQKIRVTIVDKVETQSLTQILQNIVFVVENDSSTVVMERERD